MKKRFFLIIVLIALLIILGCSKSQYRKGKYVGYIADEYGDVIVEVMVEDNEIKKVEILNPVRREDNYSYQPAIEEFEKFPQRVISSQSVDVDAVAKATGSHEKYVKATEMALNIAANRYTGQTYYGVSRDYENGHLVVRAVIEDSKIKDSEIIPAKLPGDTLVKNKEVAHNSRNYKEAVEEILKAARIND